MNIDRDKQMDLLMDQALREFPLEPAPNNLKAKIIREILKPLPAARFKISWADFVFSSALALIIGFVLNFLQSIARSPYWSARLRVGMILFWQEIRYFLIQNQSSVMTATLSVAIVLSLLVILATVYWRYFVVSGRVAAHNYQIYN